jgi:hypothetical protein
VSDIRSYRWWLWVERVKGSRFKAAGYFRLKVRALRAEPLQLAPACCSSSASERTRDRASGGAAVGCGFGGGSGSVRWALAGVRLLALARLSGEHVDGSASTNSAQPAEPRPAPLSGRTSRASCSRETGRPARRSAPDWRSSSHTLSDRAPCRRAAPELAQRRLEGRAARLACCAASPHTPRASARRTARHTACSPPPSALHRSRGPMPRRSASRRSTGLLRVDSVLASARRRPGICVGLRAPSRASREALSAACSAPPQPPSPTRRMRLGQALSST